MSQLAGRRAALLVVTLAGSVLAVAACGEGESDEAPAASSSQAQPLGDEERQEIGYDACVESASEQLKAPATAEWAPLEDVSISGTGSHWTLVGDVDAENGFGALIRSSYTCDVFVSSKGDVTDITVQFD